MLLDVLDFAFAIAGFVLLVIGYRRNDRKLLLVAALLLFLAGTASEFARGFADGFKQGMEQQAAEAPAQG